MSEKIVDLGAGKEPVHPDALTVDFNPDHDPDLVHDLENTPWPLPDNRFSVIHIHHTLEHLSNWKEALREMERVARPGGSIIVTVPHYSAGIRFPDHDNHFSIPGIMELFNPDSSMFLSDLCLEVRDLELVYCNKNNSFRTGINPLINKVLNSSFNRYFDLYLWPFIGGIDEIKVELEAVK